jgi:hypothetical protein
VNRSTYTFRARVGTRAQDALCDVELLDEYGNIQPSPFDSLTALEIAEGYVRMQCERSGRRGSVDE